MPRPARPRAHQSRFGPAASRLRRPPCDLWPRKRGAARQGPRAPRKCRRLPPPARAATARRPENARRTTPRRRAGRPPDRCRPGSGTGRNRSRYPRARACAWPRTARRPGSSRTAGAALPHPTAPPRHRPPERRTPPRIPRPHRAKSQCAAEPPRKAARQIAPESAPSHQFRPLVLLVILQLPAPATGH